MIQNIIHEINTEGKDYIVGDLHGHTPVQEYFKVGNAMFIDTGSYFKEFGYNEYPGVRILRIDDIIKNMGDRL